MTIGGSLRHHLFLIGDKEIVVYEPPCGRVMIMRPKALFELEVRNSRINDNDANRNVGEKYYCRRK